MPYIEGQLIHDADAHVMETEDWLDGFATEAVSLRLRAEIGRHFNDRRRDEISTCRALHADASYRADDAAEIMHRKNYRATGAFIKEDRRRALDLIGVASQLVFPTLGTVLLERLEHDSDVSLIYGAASAVNRAQADFCAADRRLLAVGYVPLADIHRAGQAAQEAIALGCKALLIPFACPRDHATSHIGLDRVWAQAVEAGIPILLHVGVADRVLPAAHANNGLPPETDFHGGDENFRSVSYMSIPSGPMQALSMLIFDGVLERFPTLKVGVIELGAVWLPGFLRQLDAAFDAFARHESRLQKLSIKPSDYVRRQVRVTPYPTEPTGWIIEQAGPQMCMFSSDFPHVEGGRNPMRRFQNATDGLPQDTLDNFYRRNFESLMGAGLDSL
ncbi:MAG: amidohydrolase [Gammaproteobacteria bacterium]|nr:amidohydrolase [Gammaproteobacteria bacterium]